MLLIPIDMPSDCYECPCHNEDRCYCQLLVEDDYDWEIDQDLDEKRRDNCPLREVTPPI